MPDRASPGATRPVAAGGSFLCRERTAPSGVRGSARIRRCAATVSAAAILVPAGGSAQTGLGAWRPDDRVLVADVSRVTALTRSTDRLFVATEGGLIVYEDGFGRFELPITAEDGYPLTPVTAIAFDSRDASVWLATERRLLQYDPFSRRFIGELRTDVALTWLVPGEFDGTELFAASGSEWWRVDTFTGVVRPADPDAVRAAAERLPALRARRDILEDPDFQETVLLLARRPGRADLRITDVAPAQRPGHYWVGTDGGFLFRYDHAARDWTPLAFGYRGAGAAAIEVDDGTVWFAPASPLRGRFAIARSDAELQRWEAWSADSSFSVPGEGVNALVSFGTTVWAGGDGGLHMLRGDTGEWRWLRDRIPDRALPVLAMVPLRGEQEGAWVGTARGLFRLRGSDPVVDQHLLAGERVLALLSGRGRLWVGTERGLYIVRQDETQGPPVAVPATTGDGALRRAVGALAGAGDSVFAGLGDEVWWRSDDSGWQWVEAIGTMHGRVTALAVRNGVLWVGSSEGVAVWDPQTTMTRRLSFAAGDLPTDPHGRRGVSSIRPIGADRAWLATPAGALLIDVEH